MSTNRLGELYEDDESADSTSSLTFQCYLGRAYYENYYKEFKYKTIQIKFKMLTFFSIFRLITLTFS